MHLISQTVGKHSHDKHLGSLPATTITYVIIEPEQPSYKIIETYVVKEGMLHSISYGAISENYNKHLYHFNHAIMTFEFKP